MRWLKIGLWANWSSSDKSSSIPSSKFLSHSLDKDSVWTHTHTVVMLVESSGIGKRIILLMCVCLYVCGYSDNCIDVLFYRVINFVLISHWLLIAFCRAITVLEGRWLLRIWTQSCTTSAMQSLTKFWEGNCHTSYDNHNQFSLFSVSGFQVGGWAKYNTYTDQACTIIILKN